MHQLMQSQRRLTCNRLQYTMPAAGIIRHGVIMQTNQTHVLKRWDKLHPYISFKLIFYKAVNNGGLSKHKN